MLTPEIRRAMLAPPDTATIADVVIDTDVTNEIDDQFAVVWALLRPDRIRVRGLYACPWSAGPRLLHQSGMEADSDRSRLADPARAVELAPVSPADGAQRAASELRRISHLLNIQVPVLDGATQWLADPTTPVISPVVEHLIALAHSPRPGPLYVLAIGAATNVASAVLRDPSICEEIVVVWTSAYPTFWPRPNASYNLVQDLHASRALFDSGVPLVYLPGYYVGEELRVSRADLEVHVLGKGPIGNYLWEVFDSHPLSRSRMPGFSKVIWDLITVAWMIEPKWLATDLTTAPELAQDLRWRHVPGRHEIREAYDIDRDAVFADLYRVLAKSENRHQDLSDG